MEHCTTKVADLLSTLLQDGLFLGMSFDTFDRSPSNKWEIRINEMTDFASSLVNPEQAMRLRSVLCRFAVNR